MGYVGAAMYNKGVDNLAAGTEGVADSLSKNRESKRQQNMAQTLLGLNQREEQLGQVNGQPVAGAVGSQAGENLYDFQKRGASALLLAGANPTEAAGMMKIKTAPDMAKRDYANTRADELFKQTLDTNKLAEDTRYHKAIEGDYSINSDDRGNTWKLNKNTGEREKLSSGSGINPKNIQLVPVTNRNSSGVETTNYVPVDKTTGKVVGGQDASATKYPVISNSDKTYRDDLPVIDQNIEKLEAIINNPEYADSFGQLDNAIDSTTRWLGFQNDDSEKNAEIGALSSNLLAGFGKAQMAGVLTDQDMKIIKQQIPSASDSPATAKKKIAFIKDLMNVRNESWRGRLDQSNPNWLPKEQINATTPTPNGMKKQINTDTGEVRFVPIGG